MADSNPSQSLVNRKATRFFTPLTTDRKWFIVDAKGKSVGRLATQIASVLRGKHKPTYTPHDDAGDFVVVINAKDVELRGNDKVNKKVYYKHTGFPGHVKQRTAAQLLAERPEMVLQLAVEGMIPRGSLGRQMLKKLKIYANDQHPHAAQKPETLAIGQ